MNLFQKIAKLKVNHGHPVSTAVALQCYIDANRIMDLAALILDYRYVWANSPAQEVSECQDWARKQALAEWTSRKQRKASVDRDAANPHCYSA